MTNYTQEAKKIVTDCLKALRPSEQLQQEATTELRVGHITEQFAAELRQHARTESLNVRNAACAKLDALAGRFATAAKAADAPNGDALTGGDYKLLAGNFPLSVEEFTELCERNKSNPTILRAAMVYGSKNGDLAPYAKKYYRSAAERVAMFNKLLKCAKGILDTEPTSPARGDPYWNMIAREAAPWSTL